MMDMLNRTSIGGDDINVLVKLNEFLEYNLLRRAADSSSCPSSSSSTRGEFPLDDSSEKYTQSSTSTDARDQINHRSNRHQQRKSKMLTASISVGDDRDYSRTNNTISFKSWQTKQSTPPTKFSGSTHMSALRGAQNVQQSEQVASERWSKFLDRVNEKEKEKQRAIKMEKKRVTLAETEECFFSPNLTTRSLKMAASFEQLKDRIPHLLSAREQYLEQQRLILLEKETAECTFSPQRVSADRGALYLQNPHKDPLPLCAYRPYLQEKMRKEEELRAQLLQRDEQELTFQPRTNASKYLSASLAKRLKAARAQAECFVTVIAATPAECSSNSWAAAEPSLVSLVEESRAGNSTTVITEGTGQPMGEAEEVANMEEVKVQVLAPSDSSDGDACCSDDYADDFEVDRCMADRCRYSNGNTHEASSNSSESESSGDSATHEDVRKRVNRGASNLYHSQSRQSWNDENTNYATILFDKENITSRRGSCNIGGSIVNSRRSSIGGNSSSSSCSNVQDDKTSTDVTQAIGEDYPETRCGGNESEEERQREEEGAPKRGMQESKEVVEIDIEERVDEERRGGGEGGVEGRGDGRGDFIEERVEAEAGIQRAREHGTVTSVVGEVPREVGNCHERLYRKGVEHRTRLDRKHERAHKKNPTRLPDALTPCRPHPTCERLYRDGLRKRAIAAMPDPALSSISGNRPNSSPSKRNPANPWNGSKVKDSGECWSVRSAEMRRADSGVRYQDKRGHVLLSSLGRSIGSDSEDDHSYDNSQSQADSAYMTVIHCSAEDRLGLGARDWETEGARISRQHLRVLWDDLVNS